MEGQTGRDEEVEVESQGGPWVRGLMEVRALSAHGEAPVGPSAGEMGHGGRLLHPGTATRIGGCVNTVQWVRQVGSFSLDKSACIGILVFLSCAREYTWMESLVSSEIAPMELVRRRCF